MPDTTAPDTTTLETGFPHIVSELIQCWEQGADSYLDRLLIDVRGGRQGFPPDALSELMFLSILAWWRNHPDATQMEYQAEAFSFASAPTRGSGSLADTE